MFLAIAPWLFADIWFCQSCVSKGRVGHPKWLVTSDGNAVAMCQRCHLGRQYSSGWRNDRWYDSHELWRHDVSDQNSQFTLNPPTVSAAKKDKK